MVIQARTGNFVKLLHFLVFQFTVMFTHFLTMSLHVRRRRYSLCVRFFHRVNFSSARTKYVIKHLRISSNNCFIWFAITLSTSQSIHDQETKLVLQDERFSAISSTCDLYYASFPPFRWHPQFLTEHLFSMKKHTFTIWYFHPSKFQ